MLYIYFTSGPLVLEQDGDKKLFEKFNKFLKNKIIEYTKEEEIKKILGFDCYIKSKINKND